MPPFDRPDDLTHEDAQSLTVDASKSASEMRDALFLTFCLPLHGPASAPGLGIEPSCVICPAPGCSCEYMHLVEVRTNGGGVITRVTSQGTQITQGTPDGRGVSHVIEFECEEGHRSERRFDFYKGSTLERATALADLETAEDGSFVMRPVIWRD